MPQSPDPDDPRGLIAEAFRMEGLYEPDCRSIFFDWALGLPADRDPRAAIEGQLARHADARTDHPMRKVLLEGLRDDAPARRRGGRRARGDAETS